MHRPAADRGLARRRRLAARRHRRDPHHRARRLRRRDPPPRRRDRAGAPDRAHRGARRLRRRDRRACSASTCRCPASGGPSRAGFATSWRCASGRARLGLRVPEFSPVFNDDRSCTISTGRVAGAVGAQAAIVGRGHRHQEGREPRRALARARGGRRRAVDRRARTVRGGRGVSRRLDRVERRASSLPWRSSTGRPPMEVSHQGGVFVTRAAAGRFRRGDARCWR